MPGADQASSTGQRPLPTRCTHLNRCSVSVLYMCFTVPPCKTHTCVAGHMTRRGREHWRVQPGSSTNQATLPAQPCTCRSTTPVSSTCTRLRLLNRCMKSSRSTLCSLERSILGMGLLGWVRHYGARPPSVRTPAAESSLHASPRTSDHFPRCECMAPRPLSHAGWDRGTSLCDPFRDRWSLPSPALALCRSANTCPPSFSRINEGAPTPPRPSLVPGWSYLAVLSRLTRVTWPSSGRERSGGGMSPLGNNRQGLRPDLHSQED